MNPFTNATIANIRTIHRFYIEFSDLKSEDGWVYDHDYSNVYINKRHEGDESKVSFIIAHEWMHLIQMMDGELHELVQSPSKCPSEHAYASKDAAEEQAEAFAMCLFPQYIPTDDRESLGFINEGWGVDLKTLKWLLHWRNTFEKRWPELGFPQARQLAFSLGASFEQVSHLALI